MQAKILALRHQILILQRSRGHKIHLIPADRALCGLAITPVDWMAVRIDHGEAGDCHWLASKGFPAVLEMEEPPSRRPPVGIE